MRATRAITDYSQNDTPRYADQEITTFGTNLPSYKDITGGLPRLVFIACVMQNALATLSITCDIFVISLPSAIRAMASTTKKRHWNSPNPAVSIACSCTPVRAWSWIIRRLLRHSVVVSVLTDPFLHAIDASAGVASSGVVCPRSTGDVVATSSAFWSCSMRAGSRSSPRAQLPFSHLRMRAISSV